MKHVTDERNKNRFHRIYFYFIYLLSVMFVDIFILELEETLKTHTKKVDTIKNIIWQTGLRNNNISVILNGLANNDTRQFVSNTIDTSTKISDQMREVRREAVDISSDVFKLKLKLASLEPQWAVKFGLAEENGKICYNFCVPFQSMK